MNEQQPQMAAHSALELAAAVVDVSKGEKVLHIFREDGMLVEMVCMGHGTARTEMLDLLGIGETAKVIVFGLARRERVQTLLSRLGRELEMRYPGRGIAFSVPITGIGARWHNLMTETDRQEEEHSVSKMERTSGLDVVVVVMERGFTNVAMDAARRAGACGGTVIAARGVAEDEVKRFFGIEIHAEREIVFMVVKNEERQAVMTALTKAVGMKTRSRGVVLSLPVSDAIGLVD
ncbi:MAG: hypothetical protein Q4D31_05445 [Eubacteriales bacterium]|nr:hypothetical protein [Eubacteriales bacterium]